MATAADVKIAIRIEDLPDALRKLGPQIAAGTRKGLVEGALRLRSAVDEETNKSDGGKRGPPVDTGKMAAAWKWRKTKDGAIVFNTTPQAEWIERGRNAANVSKEGRAALELWVKRKGLANDLAAALQEKASTKAAAAYLAATSLGIRARKPRARKTVSKEVREEAIKQVAFLVARSITRHGFPARFPLWRALRAVQPDLGKMVLVAILDEVEKGRAAKK